MNQPAKTPVIRKLKSVILFVSMVSMMIGLLCSRGLLSCSMIAFIAISIVHQQLASQLKLFFSSPLLWSMSLLFFLPLVSGLWSEDKTEWLQIIRTKLPLFLLPLSFAGLNDFRSKDWERLARIFLILISCGIAWSFWQYFQNIHFIHTAYLKAQTLQTPLDNDHIRFSLLVVFSILTAFYLLMNKNRSGKKEIVFLSVLIFIDIVYLHVLAVRTGLACFYIGVFIFIFWALQKQGKQKYAVILALTLLLPVISYFIFPTFKNRVSYLKYDLSLVQKNIYMQGSNDGNRFISLKAGWNLQNQHPLTGVGFGDIKAGTDSFYKQNYPQMTERILPSGEWMMYGAGNGWPGLLIFSLIMTIPFFIREVRNNIFWWLINIFILSSYFFDIGLEVQFGVFIHSFFLLWWYQWLRTAA